MKYKGFIGSVDFDLEDKVLHGCILHTTDLVTYDGESLPELEKNFQASVDQYLDLCERHQKTPVKSMSGTFNCRIGPELHKDLAIAAFERGTNINSIVTEAIRNHLHPKDARLLIYKAVERQTYHCAQVPKKQPFTSLFDIRKIALKTSEVNDRFDFSRSFNA
ncbi:MAG: type II toxin-antitoxin system HicB family antitoxin [Alcanivorax sp.]|jgi:predicted HicB family RNase H-like nuclease